MRFSIKSLSEKILDLEVAPAGYELNDCIKKNIGIYD